MKRPLLAGSIFAFVLLCSAVLSACGGGGGGGSPGAPGNIVPNASPTPCPQGYVGTPPSCQQEASLPGQFTPIAVPSATGLPAVAGYGGTILIPAANPAAQVQITLSTGNPTGVTIESRLRAMLGNNARIADSSAISPLIFITMLSAGDVVFTASSNSPGFPGFVFSLPSSAGNGPFYLAYLEGGGIWTTVAGPATPSSCAAPLTGNCVTLQPNLPPSLTISPTPTPPSTTVPAPGAAYLLLYTGGVVPSTAPSSSPGGQPTSSASAGPTPTSSSGGGSTSSPGSTPTPIPSGSTASPVSSPSTSPTVAPTGTRTATPSPTPFVSPTPTATPMAAPNGTPPSSFVMGSLQSGTAGAPFSAQPISGFQVLDSSNNQINGSFSKTVTLTSNNSAVTLCLLGNCASPTTSVSLTSGSQTSLLAMSYSGAAVTPVTITASATGATPNTASFAPAIPSILFSSNSPNGSTPEIDLYAPSGQGTGSTYTFTATQAGYTGSPYNNPILVSVPTACNSFASVSGSGTSFTVSALASPTVGSCTITLSGFSTTTLNVTLTYSTFGVTLH